jgi:hypothetical protein
MAGKTEIKRLLSRIGNAADTVAVSAQRPRPLKHFTSASGC